MNTPPQVIVGDEVYYHHPEHGVLSGPVASTGRDGVTVRQGDDHHGVLWESLLGHKRRHIRRLRVVERGEDGFIAEDEDGKRSYYAGEAPPDEDETVKSDEPLTKSRDSQALIDAALIKAGYEPSLEYIQATYGNHWTRREDPAISDLWTALADSRARVDEAIGGLREDFAKSVVAAHTRKMADGRVVQVSAYTNKRTRKHSGIKNLSAPTSTSPVFQENPPDGYIRLYHGSGERVSSICGEGVFGGIFASGSETSADSHGLGEKRVTHYMDIPEDKVLTQHDLSYVLEYNDTAESLKQSAPWVDEDDFDRLWDLVIEEKAFSFDEYNEDEDQIEQDQRILRNTDQGDAGWEVQRLRGQVAKRLGYSAVEMDDEHGTSFLVLPGVPLAPIGEPFPASTSTNPSGQKVSEGIGKS